MPSVTGTDITTPADPKGQNYPGLESWRGEEGAKPRAAAWPLVLKQAPGQGHLPRQLDSGEISQPMLSMILFPLSLKGHRRDPTQNNETALAMPFALF